MVQYRAKIAYQNSREVQTYDALRFKSWKGKLIDKLEKNALNRVLKKISSTTYILDIPCGTGRITKYLLDKGYNNVVGADISEEMLMYAKKKLVYFNNLKMLLRADGEKLGFKDNKFDCVVSVRLMGHVPSEVRIKILKEMARTTKQYIVIFYYSDDFISKLKRKIKKIFLKNPAPWFPVKKEALKREISAANLDLLINISVCPILSESHVLLLRNR